MTLRPGRKSWKPQADPLAKPESERVRRKFATPRKGVGELAQPRRVRSDDFLALVHEHPCCICAAGHPARGQAWCPSPNPIEAAHITFPEDRKGLGTKVSDYSVVGLCRYHHQQIGSSPERALSLYGVRLSDVSRRLLKEFAERWAE